MTDIFRRIHLPTAGRVCRLVGEMITRGSCSCGWMGLALLATRVSYVSKTRPQPNMMGAFLGASHGGPKA
jgi:hypothetical protein